MKLLIVEDEPLAQERLQELILRYDPKLEIAGIVDGIKKAQPFLETKNSFDLAFMDIRLSDGQVFELLSKCKTLRPIIFTTAYDRFMEKAFEVNCIDYLLKPIRFEKLRGALDKYRHLSHEQLAKSWNHERLQQVLAMPTKPKKKRFLVKVGKKLLFINLDEIAYFFSDGKHTFLVRKGSSGQFIIDHTLEQLETEILGHEEFFRINRKFIVKIDALREVRSHYNKRLKLELNTPCNSDLIVSREKVSQFKSWLNL